MMQGIIQTIVNWWRALWQTFQNLFDSFVAAVEDLFAWGLDSVYGAGISMIEAMPVEELDQSGVESSLAALPVEILNVMWLLNVPHALAIVAAAYGIRFVLQMIPFVRWGS